MYYTYFLGAFFLFVSPLLQATQYWEDSLRYAQGEPYEEHGSSRIYTFRSYISFLLSQQKDKIIEEKLKVTLKEKNYKSRLFLGEADFSYTIALLNKHQKDFPNLGTRIVATELKSKQELRELYPSSFPKNKKQLKEKGVRIFYNVDATQIGDVFLHRYQRIHFNFPHDRSPIYERTLSNLIQNFFLSASQLQHKGDRIHITLPEVEDMNMDLFRQSYVYGLYNASYGAGYDYFIKRPFNKERYPGYKHRITGKNKSAKVAQEGREYIFTKVSKPRKIQNSFLQKQIKGKRCIKGIYNCLPDYETEDDISSSYEDTSSDTSATTSNENQSSEEDSNIGYEWHEEPYEYCGAEESSTDNDSCTSSSYEDSPTQENILELNSDFYAQFLSDKKLSTDEDQYEDNEYIYDKYGGFYEFMDEKCL